MTFLRRALCLHSFSDAGCRVGDHPTYTLVIERRGRYPEWRATLTNWKQAANDQLLASSAADLGPLREKTKRLAVSFSFRDTQQENKRLTREVKYKAGMSDYLRHDLASTAKLRARLRLDRSLLNESVSRRQPGTSAMCGHCGDPIVEDVRHLVLRCPLCSEQRATLRAELLPIAGLKLTVPVVLGILPASLHLSRAERAAAFRATGAFLAAVNEQRRL